VTESWTEVPCGCAYIMGGPNGSGFRKRYCEKHLAEIALARKRFIESLGDVPPRATHTQENILVSLMRELFGD
jgi:hypothetical protein